MAAILQNISNLVRRLDISLPVAEIDHEVDDRLRRLARNVKMHGFRPGKVPLKVVAQQYSQQVRQEVLGDALQKSFNDAVRDQNLRVVGNPRFEPKASETQPPQVEFSATFEIYPEVQLGALDHVSIVKPEVTVGDVEVERTLEIMRKQRATYEPVTRPAAAGDRVTIDFSGTVDGKEFEGGKGEDMPVILGEGRLLKDFEDNIAGMESDSAKTFEIRFPEDYHSKEMAGKTATFEVKLKQVGEPRLPAVDAEFARSLGVADGDLERMRSEIRENLETEVKQRIAMRLKEQAMQALIDNSKMEIPKSLVDLEIERLSETARKDLEARGVKTEGVPIPRDLFEREAQRRVQLGLAFAEVVKKAGLQAKPDQVRALVDQRARSYEQPEQVVKWFYHEPERLREVEAMVLEDNVVNWVLAAAKVEERATPFDELMGKRQ